MIDSYGPRDAAGHGAPLVRTTREVIERGKLLAAEGVVMYRAEAERLGLTEDEFEPVDKPPKARLDSITGRSPATGVRTAKVAAPATVAAPSTGYPRHVGGGWYELSSGERVQGRDEATQAEAELDEG